MKNFFNIRRRTREFAKLPTWPFHAFLLPTWNLKLGTYLYERSIDWSREKRKANLTNCPFFAQARAFTTSLCNLRRHRNKKRTAAERGKTQRKISRKKYHKNKRTKTLFDSLLHKIFGPRRFRETPRIKEFRKGSNFRRLRLHGKYVHKTEKRLLRR